MTVRNPVDSGNVGSIYVGANAGIIVTLGVGEGLRGTNDLCLHTNRGSGVLR